MNIGIIGSEELVVINRSIFKELGHQAIAITEAAMVTAMDGLIITAWREKELWLLKKMGKVIKEQKRLAIMGLSLGAWALGRNGCLGLMDYQSFYHEVPQSTMAMVRVPSWENHHMTAAFRTEVRFLHIAPNLGILCRSRTRGPLVLRQGNFAAVSFAPELMEDRAIYEYFIEMVTKAR